MLLLLGRIGFSALFALAGLYLVAVLRKVWQRRQLYLSEGIVTEGEIVDFRETVPSGEAVYRKFYAPVVEFPIATGARCRITSSRSARPNPYQLGQRVPIRYLPDAPAEGDLDGVTTGWAILIILVVFIVVSFTVASLPFLLGPPHPR